MIWEFVVCGKYCRKALFFDVNLLKSPSFILEILVALMVFISLCFMFRLWLCMDFSYSHLICLLPIMLWFAWRSWLVSDGGQCIKYYALQALLLKSWYWYMNMILCLIISKHMWVIWILSRIVMLVRFYILNWLKFWVMGSWSYDDSIQHN